VGVFAKVPDVAISILGEPIERIFRQFAIRRDRIMDFDARDALDHPGIARHGELIVFKTLRRLTLVSLARALSCSRLQPDLATPMTGTLSVPRLTIACSAGKIFCRPSRRLPRKTPKYPNEENFAS
jgi:hypothetical protein